MLKQLAFWLGLSAVANSSPLTIGVFPKKWEFLPRTPDRLDGYTPTRIFVNNPQVALWINQYNPSQQQPVVFLHAGLADSRYFGEVAKLAIGSGSNVVLVDLRGHGNSDYLKGDTFSPELLIEDVFALIDARGLGYNVNLIGWGEGAAAVLAGLLNDKYSDRIYKAVLLSPTQSPSDLIHNFKESGTYKDFVERARQDYTSFLKFTDLTFEEFSGKVDALQQSYPQFTDEHLARISGGKVAILDPEHDEVVQRNVARHLHNVIADSTYTPLKDVSYFAPLQDPGQVWKAINDFLIIPGAA